MSVAANHRRGGALGMYSHVARQRRSREPSVRRWRQLAGRIAGRASSAEGLRRSDATGIRQCWRCLKRRGLGFDGIAQMTTYLPGHHRGFLSRARTVVQGLFPGGSYPPNTSLVVSRLVRRVPHRGAMHRHEKLTAQGLVSGRVQAALRGGHDYRVQPRRRLEWATPPTGCQTVGGWAGPSWRWLLCLGTVVRMEHVERRRDGSAGRLCGSRRELHRYG